MTNDLEERLRRVRFLVCDVDGVLTDGHMWFDGEGQPFRAMHARDGTGLTLWRLAGYQCALISGLGSKALEAIARQWKCTEYRMWVRNKDRACREFAERYGVPLEEMAFLGDDIIDLPALRLVGLAVGVADAVPAVKEVVHLATEAPGGQGAVRELVEKLLMAKGEMDDALAAYWRRKDGPQ